MPYNQDCHSTIATFICNGILLKETRFDFYSCIERLLVNCSSQGEPIDMQRGVNFHLDCDVQTALRPPSRLSIQLFAYRFPHRKTAASATSSTVPNLAAGILAVASVLAASDIAFVMSDSI